MADVVLVTGANKGLGKEAAGQLARRGLTVLLASRDPGRGAEAAGELAAGGAVVSPVQLDVTDPASVRAAANRIGSEYGRLDVLVNNAGATADVAAMETTAADMRPVFEVNVFGTAETIRAMLPLLRQSPMARIVNVSSTTASLTMTGSGHDFGGNASRRLVYSTSKTAMNMLTVQYARAFAADPGLAHIKINSATPGHTATGMSGHHGRSVADGARIIVDLATLPADGPTGGFFNDQGPVPW
jgi:NAD(P)-dependent dehydrogenase (short-subunit alcohol dehydrogenase family)